MLNPRQSLWLWTAIAFDIVGMAGAGFLVAGIASLLAGTEHCIPLLLSAAVALTASKISWDLLKDRPEIDEASMNMLSATKRRVESGLERQGPPGSD